ncbi:lipopolysaccharide biosynthesis protein [Neobacillus citreus]|nr:lipopolysaccharide biosynthesis protein [Neobacillus citreus]MCH6266011.1 lipopolysaccharide biosynthesis protein [Neobacillus citreus]
MQSNLKNKVILSLIWKLLERGGTQGIQFILQIILARLLLPKDFGLIVLVTIFITVANVFVQSGLNTALIQKKNTNDLDYSSVFYFNIIVACILYFIIYLCAPLIANYFSEPELVTILRALSITLIIGAFQSIQNAIIAIRMLFKLLLQSSLFSIVISGTLGIAMAYLGFGVWSLVIQQITNTFLVTLILFLTLKWRPKLIFSLERLRELFKNGWKILGASLAEAIYTNLRSLIISKMFTADILGFYNRGKQFPAIVVTNINGSILDVMLPTFSSQQDNIQKVKEILRRSIASSSFIVFPMMIGMAVIAEPLTYLLLTEKWLPAVPFLQIYCLIFALWPYQTAHMQAVIAIGRGDIYLAREVITKIIGLVILGITLFYGVNGIVIGEFLSSILATILFSSPNIKLLNYSYKEQFKDIIPSLAISLLMGLVAFSIKWMGLSMLHTLIIQLAVGIVVYFGLAMIFKIEVYRYLINTVKQMINKGKITSTENIIFKKNI